MTGYVEVRTTISTDEYKKLHQIAEVHDTTIGALISELTHRALNPKRPGRRSSYTTELGERIWESRWMHRSWAQIAEQEHINVETVKKYHARYEAERISNQNRSNAA